MRHKPIWPLMLALAFAAEAQNQNLRIAFSVPSLSSAFFALTVTGAQAEAKRLGQIDLRLHEAATDLRQLELCQQAIRERVDGILISPHSSPALTTCFLELQTAGIPAVSFDRRSPNPSDVISHVGVNNAEAAAEAGEFIIERLKGQGRVVELQGTQDSAPAVDRSQGFNRAIAKAPGIKRIAQLNANWNPDQVEALLGKLMQELSSSPTQPGFEAIFAANDGMALAAIKTLKDKGINPASVVVVGFDAIEAAIASIERGELTATIDQLPKQQAAMALQLLSEKLRKRKNPNKNVVLTAKVISKANLSEASSRSP